MNEERLKSALKGCIDVLERTSNIPDHVLSAYGIKPTDLRRQLSRAEKAICKGECK